MKKRSLILVASRSTLAALAAHAQTAAAGARRARGEVRLDLHRQRRRLQRLPLPRHLADQQEAGVPGRLRLGHASGFYVGNWNSNVDSAFFNGANLEMDFYGGYKLRGRPGLRLDVGVLYYYYPGSGAGGTFKIDNTELYGGAGYGPVSVKYSHAVSDFFGIDDSKNSLVPRGQRHATTSATASALRRPRRLPEAEEATRASSRSAATSLTDSITD